MNWSEDPDPVSDMFAAALATLCFLGVAAMLAILFV